MIITRYLGAVGASLFLTGAIAGYALGGSATAAAFKSAVAYKTMATAPQAVHSQNDRAAEQSIIVAVDAMAPNAYRAPRTGDGSN